MAKYIKRAGIVFFATILSLLLVIGTLNATGVVDSNSDSIVNTNTDNNIFLENVDYANPENVQIPKKENVNFEIPKADFEYVLNHNYNCQDLATCTCLQNIWNEAVQKSLDTNKNVKVTLMTDWVAREVSANYFTSFGDGIGFDYGRITVRGEITLDLNGFTIDRKAPETIDNGGGSSIIVWESILNLTDSSYDSNAIQQIYDNNKSLITEEDYKNRNFSNTTLVQQLRQVKCGKITGGKTNSGGAGGVIVFSNDKITKSTLNMYGGMITGNEATISGGVGCKTATEFNFFDGLIFDNKAQYGGGVYVVDGDFNMYGGKIIANLATNNGGGVFVSNRQMNFYDGLIGCNTATNHAGGIWVDTGSKNKICSLQMYGGVVENNASKHGTGVTVYNSGYARIYNGYIRNNYAVENSSGLLIWNTSQCEMFDGIISNNTTNSFTSGERGGAGVLVGHGSSFEMFSGQIVNNRLTTENETRVVEGAGLYLTTYPSDTANCIAKLHGGIIANNVIETPAGLSTCGAGVIVSDVGRNVVNLEINGAMQIYNNNADGKISDVYLKNSNKLNINGSLIGNGMAHIGVDLASDFEGVFTNGYNVYNSTLKPAMPFFANNADKVIVKEGNEAKMNSGTPTSAIANWSWTGSTSGNTDKSIIEVPYDINGYNIKISLGSNTSFYMLGKPTPGTEYLIKDVGTYSFYTETSCKNPVFNFIILPKEVDVLWKNTDMIYNGGYQKPIAYIAEDANCKVTTTGEQINSRSYIATAIELSNKNYKINTATMTQTFSINKAKLNKPSGEINYEYDGSQKEFLPTGFDSETMNITGNTATNVGSYTATISLKDKANYEWVDKTNNDVTINYAITLIPQVEEGEYKFIYIDEEGYRKTYKQGGIVHGVNDSDLNGGRLVLGNIAPNTSVKRFVETLGYDTSKIVIKDSAEKEIYVNGVPVDQSTYDKRFELAVGTGWRVEYTTTGGTEIIYLSVLGDINGDGRISASDCAYLREIANDKALYDNLNAEIKLASLIINKGKVTSADSEIVLNVINQKLTMDLFF